MVHFNMLVLQIILVGGLQHSCSATEWVDAGEGLLHFIGTDKFEFGTIQPCWGNIAVFSGLHCSSCATER